MGCQTGRVLQVGLWIGPSGLVEFTGHFWQAQEGNCAPFPDESRQSRIEVIDKTIWDTPVW